MARGESGLPAALEPVTAVLEELEAELVRPDARRLERALGRLEPAARALAIRAAELRAAAGEEAAGGEVEALGRRMRRTAELAGQAAAFYHGLLERLAAAVGTYAADGRLRRASKDSVSVRG